MYANREHHWIVDELPDRNGDEGSFGYRFRHGTSRQQGTLVIKTGKPPDEAQRIRHAKYHWSDRATIKHPAYLLSQAKRPFCHDEGEFTQLCQRDSFVPGPEDELGLPRLRRPDW